MYFSTICRSCRHERVVGLDVPALWHVTLAVVSLLLLDALLSLRYRWKEIWRMPDGHRYAVYVSAAVALCWWLTVLAFLGMGAVYQERIILHISWTLRLALALPLLFVAATPVLCWFVVKVCRERYWSVAWRIHYSLLTASALWVCVFFYHWNVLGWQFA